MDIMVYPVKSERFPGTWNVPCPMCLVERLADTEHGAAESMMEHLATVHEPEIAQIDGEEEEGGCDCEPYQHD